MNEGFERIMNQASQEVQELVIGTRSLIQEVMPDVVEVAWPKQNIVSYGIGPKKMSEHFCYISVFKERINLGFYYGTELPDPQNLLEGTGKLMRHIKITTTQQLDDLALHQLVESASRHLPKLKP